MLKVLMILSSNLCFVSEVWWDSGACPGSLEPWIMQPCFYCPQPPQGGYFSVNFQPLDTLDPTQILLLLFCICGCPFQGCNWAASLEYRESSILSSPFFLAGSLGAGTVWSDAWHMGSQGGAKQSLLLGMTAQQHCISDRCLCRSLSSIPDSNT